MLIINKLEATSKPNLSKKEEKAIQKLRKNKQLVIKPADKNLGTVILNATDYVTQCLSHLSSDTYIRVTHFHEQEIKRAIITVLDNFKSQLSPHKELFQFLQPTTQHSIPKFYGIPKIHKPLEQNGIPPIRPIISHTNSMLSHTAKFINHVLQPIAQSFKDYLNNSSQLIEELDTLTVPEDIILVTVDVISLYPSIPQQECLDTIHKEIMEHQELLICDPNLLTHLLSINISNNVFEFAGTHFLQVKETAMGASFSPTLANIFMSVFIKKFLTKTQEKPLYLRRYIDDIIILWPKRQNLEDFFHHLNSFHNNIKFTMNQSAKSINFLDLTIYKGPAFQKTRKLDTTTYHKENKQFEYLHFTSNHPKSIFKGLIIGEAIRYSRNNTQKEKYQEQIENFKLRLAKRGYPTRFNNKALRKVKYKNRRQYIKQKTSHSQKQPLKRPIFKCILPQDTTI